MAIPAPTPQAVVQLQTAMRACIAAERRILVVGCPPGTFPHWMTRHPSLMFWPSTEYKISDDKRVVPAEVGVILKTRLLSHALSNNVQQQAKDRQLVCPLEAYSPGAVTRLFDGVIQRPTKGEEAMVKAVGPRPVDAPPKPAMDEDTLQLIASIEDSIAGLELVKERIQALGERFASVRDQIAALDHLKALLK